MAEKKISDLPATATPTAADEFEINQAGTSKMQTRAQVHALESGEHLVLPQVDEAGTPTLAFGDGNTGFYESADNTLAISLAGSNRWNFVTTAFQGQNANAPFLLNSAGSATVPNIGSKRDDPNTGIGRVSDDVGALIAGGINVMQWGETGGATPLLGFFGTAAAVQPTTVSADSASIIAALITLGIFAA